MRPKPSTQKDITFWSGRYILIAASEPHNGSAMRRLLNSEDLRLLVHFTRNWLHYGILGFVLLCMLIGAVRGAFI